MRERREAKEAKGHAEADTSHTNGGPEHMQRAVTGNSRSVATRGRANGRPTGTRISELYRVPGVSELNSPL
jgi:hypothetical protein